MLFVPVLKGTTWAGFDDAHDFTFCGIIGGDPGFTIEFKNGRITAHTISGMLASRGIEIDIDLLTGIAAVSRIN
jgi:hypothetical protein